MIYKRGKIYWYKFTWNGEAIRESTKQSNDRVARQIEAAHRTRLAKGEAGIRDKKITPTLATFAAQKFMPFVKEHKASKPATVAFYLNCASNLTADPTLKDLPLDRIKTEHLTAFIARRRAADMATSTINRDLATLRRMLNLAEEWEVIDAARKIKLLPGENRREYVLSTQNEIAYLEHCSPLLHAVAIVMLDCGLRPEECHRLTWLDHIRDGAIEVHTGKGSGSRRTVEMTDRVASMLAALEKSSEFVFPAPTKAGHINSSTYKKPHRKAIMESKLKFFVPYSLRHTCLTRWAKAGMDPFTLKYLAGHENIATTERYIHLARTDAQDKLRDTRQRMKEKAQGRHNSRHSDKSAA